MRKEWLSKPYNSLNAYLQNTYGEKCYKIALDAGLSCPNRDGKIGTGGCIFCSAGGSGDFATKTDAASIHMQLKEGLNLFREKKVGNKFIAYFQAYTNTYGPISYLREIYTAALDLEEVIGISIATRPDCLGDEVLVLLGELKNLYPHKFIWVELGLQTIHEQTATFIKRGFPLSVFEEAYHSLQALQIPVIVHVILGLPGETKEDMYATCSYLNRFKPFGVKLQLLHILKGTLLGVLYEKDPTLQLPGGFAILNLEEYMNILIHCLEILDPDIVLHRITGDGPKDLLIAPTWSLNKKHVLNTLHKTMRERNTYQGRNFYDTGSIDPL